MTMLSDCDNARISHIQLLLGNLGYKICLVFALLEEKFSSLFTAMLVKFYELN
jgi:hypothetical protein